MLEVFWIPLAIMAAGPIAIMVLVTVGPGANRHKIRAWWWRQQMRSRVYHYDAARLNPPQLEPAAQAVFQALTRPDEWTLTEWTLAHRSGVELWISNNYDDTGENLSVYSLGDRSQRLKHVEFSEHDRQFLWLQIKAWQHWNTMTNADKTAKKLRDLLVDNK